MVIPRGEGLPVHKSNSNVYLIIVKGIMDIRLGEQEPARYKTGTIVNVPFGIEMDIRNKESGLLEFFVVKAPHPRDMRK
ncbi:MAG: cupin domain-containing protein [Actinomycetota bacterium]